MVDPSSKSHPVLSRWLRMLWTLFIPNNRQVLSRNYLDIFEKKSWQTTNSIKVSSLCVFRYPKSVLRFVLLISIGWEFWSVWQILSAESEEEVPKDSVLLRIATWKQWASRLFSRVSFLAIFLSALIHYLHRKLHRIHQGPGHLSALVRALHTPIS